MEKSGGMPRGLKARRMLPTVLEVHLSVELWVTPFSLVCLRSISQCRVLLYDFVLAERNPLHFEGERNSRN